MFRLLVPALAVAALPVAASAQAEPAWAPFYACIANTERVNVAMTSLIIAIGGKEDDAKPKSAKTAEEDAMVAAMLQGAMDEGSRKELRAYDRAAKKAIDKGYAAWAESETAAGRTPPPKKALPKLALADAKARLAAEPKTDIMEMDTRCKDSVGIKD